MSTIESKTHNNRNLIITFHTEVRSTDVETYLKRHLGEFYKHSRFTVLCGVHTSPTGELHNSDSKLIADYQSMFENIIEDHEDQCKTKCGSCHQCQKFQMWNEKEFLMGDVMPIASKRKLNGKYALFKGSVNSIKKKFEESINTTWPHVFIFATCFSRKSEINHLLRSCGLFSALTVSKERADITSGIVFQLDEEQKAFLEAIVNDPQLKDVIVGGKWGFFFNEKYI